MRKYLAKTIVLTLFSFFLFVAVSPSQVIAQTEFWSTPQKVNTTSTYAISPATVTDQQGYFHSVWMEMDNNDWSGSDISPGVKYSYWNGDSWSAPITISESDYSAHNPVIAADSNNNIYAVWQDSGYFTVNPPNTSEAWWRIILKRKTQAGWQEPVVVSGGVDGFYTQATWPAVAVDAAGTIHVVFSFSSNPTNLIDPLYDPWQVYYTRSLDQGDTWSTPVVIGNDFEDDIPSLVVDNSGNLHLAYHTRGGTTLGVKYRRLASGADGRFAVNWDPIVPLGDTGVQTYSEYPRLAVDGSGNLFIAWDEPTQLGAVGNTTVKVTRRSSAGTWWGAPFPVSTSGAYSKWSFSITGVTTDSSGNAYVGWGQKEDNGTITARYRRWTQNGNSWSTDSIIRTTNDMDAPFIYKDKWDNQHFIWTEQNAGGDWETWYSVVPAAVGSYNPASNFTLTHPVTKDTLSIPANSLSASATISAQVGPLPASYNPSYTTIPRSFTFRPHNTQFINNNIATAVIGYADSELIGADERNMRAYLWDGSLSSWSALTGRVNTGKNQISVDLSHFSLHGVFTQKVNLNFNLPAANFEGAEMPVSFDMTYAGTNEPVPAVVEGLEEPVPGSNVALILKNSSGNTIRTYYSDSLQGNQIGGDDGNYNINIPVAGLSEGDYTLEVLIGGTFIGSRLVHITAPPFVKLLPPLNNEDVYIMNDGSTVPVKFNLSVDDVILLQEKPVTVKVESTENNSFSQTFTLGEGENDIRFDSTTGQYNLNLHTKVLGMAVGKYKVKVKIDNTEVNSVEIQLFDGGKAKGQAKGGGG